MELNREQIIKALECCKEGQCHNGCPLLDFCNVQDVIAGSSKLCGDALSLIKELTEENERLTLEKTGFEAGVKAGIKVIRADTVRKMQELIAEHATNGYPRKVRLDVVDQIAKEMLEDTKTDVHCTDCKHFVGCERVCHGICDSYEVAK